MSLAAYKKTIRESESPRQVERRVLSQATHEIERHAKKFDAATDKSDRLAILADGLRDALQRNQTIWAALRNDLATPGNTIPDALKAQLISISLWVDRQSQAALAGEARIGALVEVNSNIIAGLAGQAPAKLEEA
ncbi:flagellar biosynthesis regulator FlaF [Palleronia pelagia]|uniref:Flagellar protein FlaF n=1 Tax=Palleronia pelagia TaxID=387096 RepID=A0A1H8F322_9RHOB|nr:flagellar biosynthesis regulator FlaF [Palleronia pelagia]SEN26030.1 flagellar protein FlaF [Palleronia pelagia]